MEKYYTTRKKQPKKDLEEITLELRGIQRVIDYLTTRVGRVDKKLWDILGETFPEAFEECEKGSLSYNHATGKLHGKLNEQISK